MSGHKLLQLHDNYYKMEDNFLNSQQIFLLSFKILEDKDEAA